MCYWLSFRVIYYAAIDSNICYRMRKDTAISHLFFKKLAHITNMTQTQENNITVLLINCLIHCYTIILPIVFICKCFEKSIVSNMIDLFFFITDSFYTFLPPSQHIIGNVIYSFRIFVKFGKLLSSLYNLWAVKFQSISNCLL